MHRIYVAGPLGVGNVLSLEGPDAHRVMRVLRLTPGDRLTLFDSRGREGDGEVVRCGRGKVEVRVLGVQEVDRESPLRIHLFQALPKVDRMEWVIQKATELGVMEIGALVAHRCVSRWNPRAGDGRLTRWRRIIVEAARQCGRNEVPVLSGPWALRELCDSVSVQEGLKLILWEDAGDKGLREALASGAANPREAWVVVGPEGGLEEWEVREMETAGFRPVRMGPRILRTETAGPAAVAVLQYLFGDLG